MITNKLGQPTLIQSPIYIARCQSHFGLFVIALLSIFINLLRLTLPIYMLQLLDRVISSRSLETLLMLSIITVIAISFSTLLEVLRRQMLMSWGHWIERVFGPGLFASGLKKNSNPSIRISNILRDVKRVRSFVSGGGLIAWIDVTWAPIFIIIVFLLAPLLGYVLLIGSILALLLGTLNERVTRDSRDLSYVAGKDDQDWVAAVERHHETVGSLSMMSNFAKRWGSSAFIRLDENMRTQLFNVYFFATIRLIGRLVRISIFGVGIWLVIENELTIGALIAANILSRTAFSLVQSIVMRWREMVMASKAYANMKTALKKDTQPWVSVPKSDTLVSLNIDQAGYRYPQQGKSIFRGVTLTVNPGELLFVIGQSAVGKTTFSRLVSGLFAPRSGSVRLGDVNVFQLQQNSLHKIIGTLSQETTLFQGSVRENIASMSTGDMDEVVRAAKLAGIHEVILTLPQGYDTIIVEYEPLLSSGQRKAIALARTFYGRPALITLDEPIPHLDKSTRSALFKTIQQLKSEGVIIIVTTQSKVPSKYADKVILFENKKHKLFLNKAEIATLKTSNRQRKKPTESAS